MQFKTFLFKFSLFTFFLISIFCNYSIAQKSDQNSFTLSFGGSNLHILDEHANYLIFRGTGIAPSMNYNRLTSKGMHLVTGTFYFNKLTTSADNFKTELFGGQFRYAYLRNVKIDPFSFSVGLTLSSTYFKTDYFFYNRVSWLKAIESWYWSHSAGLAFQLKHERNRNKLTLNTFVTVISNVSRPEYSSSGDYNYEENDWDVKTFGEMLFVSKNPGINLQLVYSRQLTARLNANAEYEFFYSQCRNRELIRFYMNNFRAGISYSF